MKIVRIAETGLTFDADSLFASLEYEVDEAEFLVSPLDDLVEFAGRTCYLSYDKPNPATAANKDYIANILRQGHFSVLEHASASFYVEGVSRNLLLELERHRFLSFSVLSTRYVDPEKMGAAIHPNTPENLIHSIQRHDTESRELAQYLFNQCIEDGYSKKQAREVARQVLPGNTETKFVVTGNLRAWRDVISKRNDNAADEEIHIFAEEILRQLKEIAPNSFQDM